MVQRPSLLFHVLPKISRTVHIRIIWWDKTVGMESALLRSKVETLSCKYVVIIRAYNPLVSDAAETQYESFACWLWY
jgi:hypothetical protein